MKEKIIKQKIHVIRVLHDKSDKIMKRKHNKHFGFTMIEATIAMVILAIAAAGILLPFANAAAVQEEASRQTLAANLASELMEKVLLVRTQCDFVPTMRLCGNRRRMLDTGAIL